MSKISFEKAIQIAVEQHQAGYFERAEAMYLDILRQDPGNVEALHLLGVLAFQGKNPDAAYQLISAAIRKRGSEPVYHYNLAEALHALGRLEESADSYARAIALKADYFEAHNNLGNVANELKRYAEAEVHCRRAIELNPTASAPRNNLGNALRGLGRGEEAVEQYREAIRLRPDYVEAINNLAMCLCNLSRGEEGMEQFRAAIRLNPSRADLHNNLGATLTFLGKFREACDSFQTAIDLRPDHAEAQNNLGAALRNLGQSPRAIPYFEEALKVNPDFDAAQSNLAASLNDVGRFEEALAQVDALLARRPRVAKENFLRGLILRALHRLDEAVDAIREALRLDPDYVAAVTALGYALIERGDVDEARAMLQRSVELAPDPQTHSNALLTVNYHPGYSPADLLALHRTWADAHEAPLIPTWKPHDNDRDPERRLRIGYVSPDFRGHSVSFFLEPILANHDHDRFEIIGYAHIPNPDYNTWRLRSQIDHWRDISRMTADEVAEKIREDEVDILVELAGHTGGNSLPVFARKPAPVQINMIGFPSTTGLSAIDYRVTDERADPPGDSDKANTEQLLRMPGVFWVYRPPENTGDVGPLPADDNNGMLTFTSVNNFTKVTPDVQLVWAKTLRAIPNSRLILQTSALSSQHTRDKVTALFAEHGVAADRLDFRPWSDLRGYFDLLERSDLTLDPFPFNGGTTTCHSLWMGAPVLTLAGDRHASRMGLSMLQAIGLPEFIAYSPDEYVAIAVRMANDLPHLRAVRAGMRGRLKSSPLMDEAGYTRDLEAAYRRVWRAWCLMGA